MPILRPLSVVIAGILAYAPAADAQELEFACPRMEAAELPTEEYGWLVQGYDGWFFRTAADLTWRFNVGKEALHYIRRLNGVLAEKGARLAFAVVPPRGLVAMSQIAEDAPHAPILTREEGAELYRHFVGLLGGTGVVTPDLLTPADEIGAPFYYKRDHHWSPEGARAVAKAMAAAIRANGLAGLDTVEFSTVETGAQDQKEGMAMIISQLCEDTIPPEPSNIYDTQQAASDADDLGLFGDDAGAEVVLLGSSFSDVSDFNFDGFLSDELGVVVANRAISGGRFSNAAISYFSSHAFAENPPDAIVWEFPVYSNVSRSILQFRQMIPAVSGSCPDPAGRASGALSDTLIVTLPEERGITGPGNFAFVSLADPTVTKITFEIAYADGEVEMVPLDRSERFHNEGRFFLEFSDDITAPVTSVRVSSVTGSDTETKLSVCASPVAQNAG